MFAATACLEAWARFAPAGDRRERICEQREDEAAADWRRFLQAHLNTHAELEALARLFPDERVRGFVVNPTLWAKCRNGREAVGLGFVETDEEAKAGDAGDAAFEVRADAVGEEG